MPRGELAQPGRCRPARTRLRAPRREPGCRRGKEGFALGGPIQALALKDGQSLQPRGAETQELAHLGRCGATFGMHEVNGHRRRLVVNKNSVKVAAAVAGQGIARALSYQVAEEVRDGRLRVILARHEPPPVPAHLVHPEGRAVSAKVREFLRFSTARLRALPILQGKGLEGPG